MLAQDGVNAARVGESGNGLSRYPKLHPKPRRGDSGDVLSHVIARFVTPSQLNDVPVYPDLGAEATERDFVAKRQPTENTRYKLLSAF